MDNRLKALFKEVIKEANLIRKHATEEERSLLDINYLNPDRADACIYGLMTGHCDSSRARELLSACAITYTSSFDYVRDPVRAAGFDQNDKTIVGDSFSSRYNFSAIEFYISNAEDSGESVAEYILGTKPTLTMKDLEISYYKEVEELFEYQD